MGFLSTLKKIRQKEKEMRILILGLDNAGKTTILKLLNGDDPTTISPTLGFNIKTICYDKYVLNMWDVGGQKSLRSYWKNYFECTDGVIWVVDSTDRTRIADCKAELHSLIVEERLVGASLLVLANKADLSGCLSLEEIRDTLELDKIESHHYYIVRCSGITGLNVLHGLDWIVNDVAVRIFSD